MPVAAQDLRSFAPVNLVFGRFPIHWITDHAAIEEFVAKIVWAAVPLEYYVLNQFSGGLQRDDFEAVALTALAFTAAIFVVSSAIGWRPSRSRTENEQRVRSWSMGLVVTWTATLVLLALSYLLGRRWISDALLVQNLRVDKIGGTFLIYLAYSAGALLVVVAALWAARKRSPGSGRKTAEQTAVVGPTFLSLALVNALLMTLLHGFTTIH